MNSEAVNGNDSPTPGNLFDEFEDAFQNCLAPLLKDDPLNEVNVDELRTNAEVNVPKFLELAHRMDAAFLQKRFLLSVQKPELLIMEENHEMRVEMGRKDELIKKQTEKLSEWQNTLMNLINRVGSVPPNPANNRSPVQNLISSSHGTTNHASNVSQVTSAGSVSNLGPPLNQASTSISSSQPVGSSPSVPANRQNMMGVQAGGVSCMNFQPMNARGHNPNLISGGSHLSSTPSPQGGCQPHNAGAGGVYSGFSQSVSNVGQVPQAGGGLQGPLAYLEKTTTNIGMPDQQKR